MLAVFPTLRPVVSFGGRGAGGPGQITSEPVDTL